ADQFRPGVAAGGIGPLNMSEFRCKPMRACSSFGLAVTGMLMATAAGIAQSPARVAVLAQQADIKTALDHARTTEAETIADQIRFCEVPAPPFNEAARGRMVRD